MRRLLLTSLFVLVVCTLFLQPRFPSFADDPLVSTFSIVAIDPNKGEIPQGQG